MRRALAGAVLVALAACGGDGGAGALDGTEEALAGVESGTLHVRLAASTADAGPVGFDLAGRFAVDGEGLPVLDMTSTRLLGDTEAPSQVVSTGDAVFVTVEGTTYEVPEDRTEELAAVGSGLRGLDVADWVEEPEESDGEEVDGVTTTRVTGRLDLAALLDDLAAVEGSIPELDDDARERLQGLVRDGEIEVLVGTDDDVVRRVTASAELAGEVPAELQDALGRVAGARLEVLLELSGLGATVEVDAPADAEPLPDRG